MPDTFTRDDPTLRQRIARMLSGDSKPGSVRHHLADALAGGQVEGAGSELPLLTTMTPLGVLTSADESSRYMRQGRPVASIAAAAGMIPGAGKGAGAGVEAALKLIKEAGSTMTPEVLAQVGKHLANEAPGSAQAILREAGLNPNSLKEAMAHHAENYVGKEALAAQNTDPEVARLKAAVDQRRAEDSFSPSAAAEAQRARGFDPTKGNPEKAAAHEADMKSRSPVQTPAAKGDAAMAEHDAVKQNFIKNAMEDEGGNVPEEVADVLGDHLTQHATGDKRELVRQMLSPLSEKTTFNNPEALKQALVDHYSIPEMLAMHYDLNPEMMGKAYEMPSTVKRGMKPTQ